MKIKTSYNLSKRNDQGEELIVMLEIEDEVEGTSSQEEVKKRIQAETNALMEALQGMGLGMNNADIQVPMLPPCASTKRKTFLTAMTAKNQRSTGAQQVTDKQIKMINTIVPLMGKTIQGICQEYNVSSVSELDHSQVNEIKERYDEYMWEHPEKRPKGYGK